jgi:recombinational DNA repair protein (RecF pathway)
VNGLGPSPPLHHCCHCHARILPSGYHHP